MPRQNQLLVSTAERALLDLWVRSGSSPVRLVRRSRIVLLLDEGFRQSEVAEALGLGRRTVARWEQRFRDGGPEALRRDRPGRGRPKGRRAEMVARVLRVTQELRVGGDSHSARAVAALAGISHSTVLRVWRDTSQRL
jgi:DNA invertase Pin-like site-specific DNA recombinase